MFDNIIGQEAVVEELIRDIHSRALPQALLFHGSPLSGKLTTALELARVLQCLKGTAEWSCDCQACSENRLLEHPYLLLLGPGNFVDEIRAATAALLRTRQLPARFLLVRAVRKLTRRFDPVLWEGMAKLLAPFLGQLQDLEDALARVMPMSELPDPADLEKITNSIVELAAKIRGKIRSDTIPIHQIRKVSFWAHTTSQKSRKVIILQNSDRMLDASRNALLKILEEPPADTYFILITSRKESIIPTVKSRLRQIQFADRTPEVSDEILKRIFRETTGTYHSLKQFFLACSTDPLVLKRESERFYQSLLNESASDFFTADDGDSPFLSDLEDRKIFAAFLQELTASAREHFRQLSESGALTEENIRRFERWNVSLRGQFILLDSLNLSPRLLVENLFQEMLTAV